MNWDTLMVPNGSYAIEAELGFATNDPVASVPVTVTVSNLFSFPNYLTQEFGSQMWIYAQTAPNAEVEIDIYDETNAYVGSFYPTSDANGFVSFTWDLTDGNGNTFPDTNFLGVWTLVSS
ncbi:MAG: FlgD immunoglobulin-like domain containing protein, partial [Limisphaerales bacterium]